MGLPLHRRAISKRDRAERHVVRSELSRRPGKFFGQTRAFGKDFDRRKCRVFEACIWKRGDWFFHRSDLARLVGVATDRKDTIDSVWMARSTSVFYGPN